ncbi:hypothetical protein G4Z16_00820 [Streptomyces bathyalis]|uniref:Secreted protein n=1 Tax=Streptomyces bathyalis TaxID=2710756 RepID=A0A7T1TC91_9ACTN|nr:hypothetical protein G4Z16_00820 [Streptomyces bathyalis]
MGRRITAVAVALAVLLALAGFAAWMTGRSDQSDEPRTPPASTGPAPAPSASASDGAVADPPQTGAPLTYGKAAARMLWTYDTRETTREQQLAGMREWMTRESRYADWDSIASQVPDPVLWSRMRDNAQHAKAEVGEAHYPAAFKKAVAQDPSALTEAYIYAVTVTGKQKIAWKSAGGGSGAEGRSVTLAVQCRPNHSCALVAIAPQVAP